MRHGCIHDEKEENQKKKKTKERRKRIIIKSVCGEKQTFAFVVVGVRGPVLCRSSRTGLDHGTERPRDTAAKAEVSPGNLSHPPPPPTWIPPVYYPRLNPHPSSPWHSAPLQSSSSSPLLGSGEREDSAENVDSESGKVPRGVHRKVPGDRARHGEVLCRLPGLQLVGVHRDAPGVSGQAGRLSTSDTVAGDSVSDCVRS